MPPSAGEQKGNWLLCWQLQPQEISPPPTANLDRSNDRVYENVTGLVKAVIEMSSKIQPAPPEEYVPMVKVKRSPAPAEKAPVSGGSCAALSRAQCFSGRAWSPPCGPIRPEPRSGDLLLLTLTPGWACPGAAEV